MANNNVYVHARRNVGPQMWLDEAGIIFAIIIIIIINYVYYERIDETPCDSIDIY